MMDDLSYDHDELVAQSDYIYTNRNAPFNAEYSEKERIQYGRSIREASETIRAIIPAVVPAPSSARHSARLCSQEG